MAIGVKNNPANHIPTNGDTTFVSAKFWPILMSTKYIIKMIAAITTGAPKPPFLINAPKEAPTKNNTIIE